MMSCADNWKHLQANLINFLRKEFSVDWLGCDHLPSILDGDECWASIYKKPYDRTKLSRLCYHESDRHYVGRVSRTLHGDHCQRWDSLCPHFHYHWPEFYPELNNSENFCRNPGGEKLTPWCYTTNKNQNWDYCSVPMCSALPATPAMVMLGANGSGAKSRTTSAIVVVLGFFGCFVCVSVCYFYYRARFKSSSAKNSTDADVDRSSVDGETIVVDDDDDDNDSIYGTTVDLNLKKLEIPRKNFICRRPLAKNFNRIVFEVHR